MEPAVCTLLRRIHSDEIDVTRFPFVEAPQAAKKKKKDEKKYAKGATDYSVYGAGQGNKKGGSNHLENPRLFVFVVGGLTHHEMCSMADL